MQVEFYTKTNPRLNELALMQDIGGVLSVIQQSMALL